MRELTNFTASPVTCLTFQPRRMSKRRLWKLPGFSTRTRRFKISDEMRRLNWCSTSGAKHDRDLKQRFKDAKNRSTSPQILKRLEGSSGRTGGRTVTRSMKILLKPIQPSLTTDLKAVRILIKWKRFQSLSPRKWDLLDRIQEAAFHPKKTVKDKNLLKQWSIKTTWKKLEELFINRSRRL
jgi:hypothetical protein